jgi:translocation and assembly module TamB
MSVVGRTLRWLGVALGLAIIFLIGGAALLQTEEGKTWLARTIERTISAPDFTVAVTGLHGTIPFNIKVDQIDIGDRDGTYLTAHDFGLNISAAALLARQLRIRWLSFGEVGMARSSTAPPSTTPLTEYFKIPAVPIGVVLDRLSIDRLAVAAPVLGESLVATVEGSARLAGETAHVALELQRTDGTAGNIHLAMDLAGGAPTLKLQLEASEPTGVLLDRVLGRTDRLPLALSLSGTGPLADWHGRLSASGGNLAHADADLTLAIATEKALGVSGTAAIAPLLPPTLAILVGDRLAMSARARFGDQIVIDALSIDAALGKITGNGAFGGPNDPVAAHLIAEIPELSPLAGLLANPIRGSGSLAAEVSGTESRPQLRLNLSGTGIRFGSSGAEHVEAIVSATPTDVLDNPEARIKVAAQGGIEGLVTPEGVVVPAELGRDIDWSLDVVTARDGSAVNLTGLSAKGVGLTLTGAGQLAERGQSIEGGLRLSVTDLRPFSGLAGYPLAGSIDVEGNAAQQGTAGVKAKFHGSAKGLRTGIPAADAVLGDTASITGSMQRDQAGTLTADQVAIAAGAASLLGEARFDPASSQLRAAIALDVPRLKPLGPALGTEMRGALSAHVDAAGELNHLRLKSEVDGSNIAAAGARIDRLRLVGEVTDLAEPKATLAGTYRTGGLDGTLSLVAESNGTSELVLPRLRLTAADSAIEGSLRLALDTFLISGSISGRARDLGRLSQLAGVPLGGDLDFAARLDARGGQLLDLSLNGTRLAAGGGSSRIAIGSLAVKARFADILRAPSGSGHVSLTSANLGKAELATANLTLDAPRAGRFAFQADAKGSPLTVALAGDGGFSSGGAELRLARLDGSLGSDRISLDQPLTLSKRGADLAFSNLALNFGTGRITGNGALRGESLSLTMNAANMPIASASRLLGYSKAKGKLTIAATLGGTLHAPVGHVAMNARELTVASLKHSGVPPLGIGVDGSWNGRNIDLKGQVTGLKEDTISFAGSAPLLLTPSPLGLSVPPAGRLSFQLRGAGQIEHMADLLPLGEDRVSGHFAADIAVEGTVAAPSVNGRVRLSDARYENFATGAVLTNMQADLVGDRDRLTLSSFSAGDTADGSINAQGNVILNGPSGPSAELSATLAHFRVAARDEAVATATGTVSIAGPLNAPKVTAPITVDRADISLPSSLPPNVVVLKVVETGGKTGKKQPPAPPAETPALPATLDIKVDMPGNIFVRGHGLESEWRGKLTITGTSAEPAINGHLEQIRGSVDLLGKTFSLTRGVITFDGTAKLDPVLDIAAETSTADITAQVNISGFASAPKITLTSTPVVPQDEILARVMFGKGVGQMTAGEGLQLAAAAASLAGGGPDVLDRLRGKFGLDYFKLGSGSTGATTGSLNPGATSNSATGGTALSAGKYIAPGVSVGVSQGVSPPTSKVTVEIEVRPHLTVGGEAGQSGSTGIGLNYNYDY